MNHSFHRLLQTTAALLFGLSTNAHAQALFAATRAGDLQAGGTATVADSHYLPVDTQGNPAPLSDLSRQVHAIGGGAYVSFDTREHWGAELDFHRVNATNDTSSQTSYELGVRYIVTHKFDFAPYVRAGFGRGLYGYSKDIASVGYNLYGLAIGTDYRLSQHFNLRAEYEYQGWLSVPIKNPQPQVLSIDIAYHFPAGKPVKGK